MTKYEKYSLVEMIDGLLALFGLALLLIGGVPSIILWGMIHFRAFQLGVPPIAMESICRNAVWQLPVTPWFLGMLIVGWASFVTAMSGRPLVRSLRKAWEEELNNENH